MYIDVSGTNRISLNATKADGFHYATCATAAGTVAKEVVLTDYVDAASIVAGFTVVVKFTNSNTASNPTLTLKYGSTSVSSGKKICTYGTTAAGTQAITSWSAGSAAMLTFDGTNWIINNFANNYNITWGTAAPSGGVNGDIYLQYS